MKGITSKELRNAWIRFYEERGHINIGAVSLIGDGSTGVMFNVAGMQPLMPYLLGKEQPSGKKRLCNAQGCVRTVDIESVGDPTHFTFFEMMGNWSLGDYFKKEKTQWSFDLLTRVFGLDGNEICSTVFEGNDAAPRDEETAGLLKEVGIKPEHIFYLPKSDNWWELEGTTGTPCGPDNEWFYPRHNKPCGPNCGPACGCGRYVEIGNDVYMQYVKNADGYAPLANKNVDTGFGLDRMLAFLNGLTDGYKTDLFWPVIEHLEERSGKKYDEDPEAQKAMRIVADHIRTSTMLIGDVNGILPSNVGAGYILRRLLRRAIRYTRQLGLESSVLAEVSKIFIEQIYDEAYPLRFEATLVTGMKEFNKCITGIRRKNEFMAQKDPAYQPETEISGKQAFRLYDTYGFPLELTEELAAEEGLTVDANGFAEAFKEHQAISKQEGAAKGGLTERNEETAKLHTATHLLQAALRKVQHHHRAPALRLQLRPEDDPRRNRRGGTPGQRGDRCPCAGCLRRDDRAGSQGQGRHRPVREQVRREGPHLQDGRVFLRNLRRPPRGQHRRPGLLQNPEGRILLCRRAPHQGDHRAEGVSREGMSHVF